MSESLELVLEPLDSWFFRDARPYTVVGGTELSSIFPPPARTVVGAIRSAIAESFEADFDWYKFRDSNNPEYSDLRTQIGDAQSMGKMRIRGPYLVKDGQRLYPVPLHVLGLGLKASNEMPEIKRYALLTPRIVAHTSHGKVHLAALDQNSGGASILSDTWLTAEDLQKVLSGSTDINPISSKECFVTDPRVGIARNNSSRKVIDGLLYQTCHIRLKSDIALAVELSGVDMKYLPKHSTLVRFGGDGRGAFVRPLPTCANSLCPISTEANKHTGQKLLIALLTPGDFGGTWLPPEFEATKIDGCDCWTGTINGVSLTIFSAATGKLMRQGGWDIANNCSRPVLGLVPPGSVYFCKIADEHKFGDVVAKLHNIHIGNNCEFGFGEIALGIW